MNNVITTVVGMMLAGTSATMTVSYAGDALQAGLSRSVAATAVSNAVQVVAAVQLHDVQEGARYGQSSLQGLVDAGYLRAVPPNPAHAGDIRMVVDGSERAVAVPLGEDAAAICRAVARMDAAGVGCSRDAGLVLVRV